jgi:hypothetical protein
MPSHSTSFSSSKFNLTSLMEEVQITNSVHNDLNRVINNLNPSDQNKVNSSYNTNNSSNNNPTTNLTLNRMGPRSKDVVVSLVSIYEWEGCEGILNEKHFVLY